MAQFFSIRSDNPQPRLVRKTVAIVRAGGVIVYPTDSCYALGCQLGDKSAMQRIRTIRDVDERHHFTLVCLNLAQAALYARIDDVQYRLIKDAAAGGYTFILRATREVPRRLQHPRRKTIGVRFPAHPVAHALLTELAEPLVSSTLLLPGDPVPLTDPEEIRQRLEQRVDLVVDAGTCGVVPSTVVDLTHDEPVIIRRGKGSIERLGAVTVA
jgi:tRNA threonylcarbamoyl adenosine modification protein (Sua5/YciO/YrdC/YwlC family)